MDLKVRQELHSTIEKLTHSGAPSLNQELMKKIKNTCKKSEAYVRAAYEMVMHDLEEDHAEIRLSAFQITNELFIRSSIFRELLTLDFKKFANLVTGTDPLNPLPPPKDAAARLKKNSLLAIKEWNQAYGNGYPKLKLGFNFLKYNRKVDFEQLIAQNEAERRRREEREVRQRAMLQQRIQDVKQEMIDLKQEVDGCLTEVESCFNLLLPRFDMPDIYTSTDILIQDDTTTTSNSPSPKSESPPPHGEVRARKRTVSSGSFVSLSEGSISDSEEEDIVQREGGLELNYGGEEEDLSKVAISGEGNRGLSVGADYNEAGPSSREEEQDDLKAVDNVTSSQSTEQVSDSDSDVEWEDVEPVGHLEVDLQEHGLVSRGFSVALELSRRVEVKETEDNSSILTTLRERRQLLMDHYLPALGRCMEWMIKAGEEENVRAAIDMKARINKTLAKYNKLNILFKKPLPQEKSPSPSSSQNSNCISATHVTNMEWKFGSNVPESVNMELDPTTPQAQLAKLKKRLKDVPKPVSSCSDGQPNSAKNSDLLSRAPVVPFGMDLYHWESSATVEPRTLAPIGSLHRFWAQETEVTISKDEQDRLKCRTISFPGSFQPVTKSCRAVLPSGKLCPRRDRFKCPFHGTIIPRDEHGNPVNPVSIDGPSQQPPSLASDEPPLWQDQGLEGDVMAGKGLEPLPSKKRKAGRGKKKAGPKYPGLTDLTTHVDTPRKRLQRKVLNRESLRRVAEDMDNLATKKYNDKFGNSFNYALKK